MMEAYIDTQIWLALRSLITPIETALATHGIELIEPHGVVPIDKAVLLISDARNPNERVTISGGPTLRSGNLMLTIGWPTRKSITHTGMLQLAGMIVELLPADHHASQDDVCVRITAEPSVRQPYRQESMRYCPVVVPWSNN